MQLEQLFKVSVCTWTTSATLVASDRPVALYLHLAVVQQVYGCLQCFPSVLE